MTRSEEHKCARLKVEVGVRLALEARQRAEEEEDHTRLENGEEVRLVEEARLKAEEEEQTRLRHAFPKKQGRNQRNISVHS